MEPRLLIAYSLILVLILAAIATVLYLRNNSRRARLARDSKRDRQQL